MQSPIQTAAKAKWEWLKIASDLFIQENEKTTIVSLEPSCDFKFTDCKNQIKKLNTNLSVDIQKIPKYTSDGWSWHKSCIFPTILVKLKLQDIETKIQYPQPKNLYVIKFKFLIFILNYFRIQTHLFITKIQQVKTSSQTKLIIKKVKNSEIYTSDFANGVCIISRIQIKTTTYIQRGKKLYFLIVISTCENIYNDNNLIVCGIISPGLFVDSRKFASIFQKKKLQSYVTKFNPDFLNRQFFKTIITEGNCKQLEIQNNVQGLLNYLTATNIRNKIKHPLFLCIKFSNCFEILYNQKSKIFQKTQPTIKKILQLLQNCLQNLSENCKKQKKNQSKKKLFVIQIDEKCGKQLKLKILQNLQTLYGKQIQVIQSKRYYLPHYTNIMALGDAYAAYVQYYKQFQEKMINSHVNILQKQLQQQLNDSQICTLQKRNKQKRQRKQKKIQHLSAQPNVQKNLKYNNIQQNQVIKCIRDTQNQYLQFINCSIMVQKQILERQLEHQLAFQRDLVMGYLANKNNMNDQFMQYHSINYYY